MLWTAGCRTSSSYKFFGDHICCSSSIAPLSLSMYSVKSSFSRPATDLKSVVLFTEAVNQVQPHIHKSCISGFKAADYKSRTYLILMHSKGTWARNFSTCGYFYPSWLQIHYRASHPNKLKFDGFKVKIIWNYSNSCSSTDLYKGDSDPGLMIVSVSNWLPQALE
jgi:hypothetical protein